MKTGIVLTLACAVVVAVAGARTAYGQWPGMAATVPEPSSLALLGGGLLMFAGVLRGRIK